MDISFSDKGLRKLCEKGAVAEAKLGKEKRDLLHLALADIEAAETIFEVPWGRFEVNPSNSREGCFSLSSELAIQLRCAHLRPPTTDRQVDWRQVTRIVLIKIEVSDG